MAIKMAMKCSRCHRDEDIELESVAMGTALEDLQNRKAATLVKLQEFVESLPAEELPDFFAVLGDKTLVHSYLCDPKEDHKRSCAKRVGVLLEEVTELAPKKPRTKKEKEPAVETKPVVETKTVSAADAIKLTNVAAVSATTKA